jgi:hypothetical protein
MRSRVRGATQVNVLWFIFTLVLLIMALASVAFQTTQMSDRDAAVAQAQQAAEKASDDWNQLNDKLVDLSRAVGFHDPNQPGSYPTSEAATTALEGLRSTFSNLTPEVKTIQEALPLAIEAFNQRGEKIATLEGQGRNLQSELEQARTAQRNIVADKDRQIAELRTQLSDAENRRSTELAQSESTIQALRQQNRDLDAQVRQAQTDAEQAQAAHRRELAVKDGRIDVLRRKTAIEKEPDRPDGRVVSVSTGTDLAFIDLGAKHRIRRGMRFQVLDGSPGGGHVKAWVEVREPGRDLSEVAIFGVADRFDPVVSGDIVANPLYDREMERNAVLLGRFSGRFNRRNLELLLNDVGVTIQPDVDVRTDFLILGSEEEEAVVEQGPRLEETETYKKAEALGVQILPLRDIQGFFKL